MSSEIMEINERADYRDFSLVSGGLIYNMTSFIRKNKGEKKGRIYTAIFLSIVTWLPICILSLIGGSFIDDSISIGFFEDFFFHLRCFVVLPFLVLVEKVVNTSFVQYVKSSDDLISGKDQEQFNELIPRLNKLTDSIIPEAIVLCVIYFMLFVSNKDYIELFISGRSYLSSNGDGLLSAAGWYYMLICLPILQLVIFRWLWRWIIWAYSVNRISKMDILVDPLHADRMAGLSYLSLTPLMFSFILISSSMAISANIGLELIYEDGSMMDYLFPVGLYIVTINLILYLPLLFFTPVLLRAKAYGIRVFGNLLRQHNIAFRKKWMSGTIPENENTLGSMDNSSLADINGSYGPIENTRLVAIDFKMFVLSIIMVAIPFVPLVFTYYSFYDLIKMIGSAALGI